MSGQLRTGSVDASTHHRGFALSCLKPTLLSGVGAGGRGLIRTAWNYLTSTSASSAASKEGAKLTSPSSSVDTVSLWVLVALSLRSGEVVRTLACD